MPDTTQLILLNSDTIVPSNLIPTLLRPLLEDASVSSSTAWSNNASVYSIPNSEPDHLAENPEIIDWISERSGRGVRRAGDIRPFGRRVLHGDSHASHQDVGLMDPVFGRGYSEEIDWCLRSHTMGYTSVLAPSCFVYHAGSGITKAEGLVGDGDRTVNAHQAIIDQRYPLYISQLIALPAFRHHRWHARTRRHGGSSSPPPVRRATAGDESPQPTCWATVTRALSHRSGWRGAHDHGRLRGIRSSIRRGRGRHPADSRSDCRAAATRDQNLRPRERARELEAEAARSGAMPVLRRAPYRERVF